MDQARSLLPLEATDVHVSRPVGRSLLNAAAEHTSKQYC
jgi:hypothetical protein